MTATTNPQNVAHYLVSVVPTAWQDQSAATVREQMTGRHWDDPLPAHHLHPELRDCPRHPWSGSLSDGGDGYRCGLGARVPALP